MHTQHETAGASPTADEVAARAAPTGGGPTGARQQARDSADALATLHRLRAIVDLQAIPSPPSLHRPLADGLRKMEERLDGDAAAVDAFEEGWSWLTTRLLTSPFLFPLFFGHILRANPRIGTLLQMFHNRQSSPDAERVAVLHARWLAAHRSISGTSSLLGQLFGTLLRGRTPSSPPFEYARRYLAFEDLLTSAFIDPRLRALHESVFLQLHQQTRYWPGAYCAGYAYQGMAALGIRGIKPTEERVRRYGIEADLRGRSRILDVGSNCGFLALHVAQWAERVDAVELNPYLGLVGREAAAYLGRNNVRFLTEDFATTPSLGRYDAAFSLSNHHTIDNHLDLRLEEYVAKLFHVLEEDGLLFFESHNVFGPGKGGPGDDGDLEKKFDIVERYFEIDRLKMVRAFVPSDDIDKLFVVLRRRKRVEPDAVRTLDLAAARRLYDDATS